MNHSCIVRESEGQGGVLGAVNRVPESQVGDELHTTEEFVSMDFRMRNGQNLTSAYWLQTFPYKSELQSFINNSERVLEGKLCVYGQPPLLIRKCAVCKAHRLCC